MTQIVKTKFLCKSSSRRSSGGSSFRNTIWKDRFIEGNWYEGEYETWSFEDGFRINNGWRRYWVVDEQGNKEEIPKSHMRILFEFDLQQLRDRKIEDLTK